MNNEEGGKSISEIENTFKELQDYSDDQFRSIVDLKKQIALLKEENAALKLSPRVGITHVSGLQDGSGNNSGDIVSDGTSSSLIFEDSGISKEQMICESQLAILRDRSLVKELTLEEAKKFQIYSAILSEIKLKSKSAGQYVVEKLSNEQLLAMADIEHNGINSSINT